MRAAKTAAVQASRSPLGATEARGVLAQAVINHTLNTRPNIESGANLRAGGRAEQRYDPTASISTAGQLLTQPIDRLGNSIGRSNRREFLTATGGNTRLSRHARDARIPNNTVIVHLVRPARHERSASEHSLSDDERDDLA